MGNPDPNEVPLARRLGLFDATMIVMGGIIGAGIFVNPAVVARNVHTPLLVLAAWLIGGMIALLGAFVYAELAALRPRVGGQYAYLRDAYHPIVAFLYRLDSPSRRPDGRNGRRSHYLRSLFL